MNIFQNLQLPFHINQNTMTNYIQTFCSKVLLLSFFVMSAFPGLQAQKPAPKPPTVTPEVNVVKPEAKKVKEFARWQITVGMQLPFRKPNDRFVDQVTVMNFMTAPGTYEQIFDHLGGTFYVGPPDPPILSAITLSSDYLLIPGIGLTYRHSRFIESFFRFHYYQTKFSSRFPITVSPQDPIGNPYTVTGGLDVRTQGLIADVGLVALLTPGKIRPMVRSGVRAQLAIDHESNLYVHDLTYSWPSKADKNVFLPYAGAGIRFEFGRNICLDAGLNFGYLPALKWRVHGDVGIGVRF